MVDGLGFAFEPRTVVAQPKAFGRVRDELEPAAGVSRRDPRFRAAMLQHLMAATASEEALLHHGKSPSQLVVGEGRGLSADRVRRVFRGETMAQITDLTYWAGHFPAVSTVLADYLRSHSDTPSTDIDFDDDLKTVTF